MTSRDVENLYIIAYLISQTENEEVVGYSSLAAKLHKFITECEKDKEISNSLISELDELVNGKPPDLDWSFLEKFLQSAVSSGVGSMFISINTKHIHGNKWKPKFESDAPTPLLENKMEEISERENKLKEKIRTASATEIGDLIT